MGSLMHGGFTLTIGHEFRTRVEDLAEASRLYRNALDDFEREHGPGVEMPCARVIAGERTLRVSYNGNIYDGEMLVQEAV
jgi:hypothetical protein